MESFGADLFFFFIARARRKNEPCVDCHTSLPLQYHNLFVRSLKILATFT